MKYTYLCVLSFFTLFSTLLVAKPSLLDSNDSVYWHIPSKRLPLPSCASSEIQNLLASIAQPDIESRRTMRDKSKEEWQEAIDRSRDASTKGIQQFAGKMGVHIEKEKIEGVAVYRLTPKHIDARNKDKLFIYLHGGAYLFGGGMSGLTEALLIANRVGIEVVAVDYGMPPSSPFPAGLNDVVTVYQSLMKSYPHKALYMGGSSSGGGLALATVHQLKAEKLALPHGLFIGTPWSDLTKTGDSLYVNEGIDRKIVTYDGFLPKAVALYAGKHSLKDPLLSPVYGDFSHFPPTMLVSGTRDLFLSLTVRVHRKMKAANVIADLNVYEGLSHVEYFVVPDAPESYEVYAELKKFLQQYP